MAFLKDLSLGVNLLGRDISASDALKKLGKNAGTTEARLQQFGKNAAKSIQMITAAAGAAAIALGVDAVKSAIEDEKAAATLAKTLQQTTGATAKQTAAVEDYISKTQISTGVLDDELRPSLARLVRSTGDVTKAQKLQQLALDISAASGKDLNTVTMALAKANDGQLTGLKKLGITLGSQAKNAAVVTKVQESYNKAVERAATVGEVWGKDSKQYQSSMLAVKAKQQELNDATAKGADWVGELSAQYKGSLDKQLDTTAGKIALMNAKWDDTKEKMGYALIDGLQPLLNWATGPEGQAFIEDFMKEFSKAAISVAQALPQILSMLKKVGSAAAGMGIDFKSFLSPEFLAAGAAFTLTPGPVQVKGIAAIAAYAAASGAVTVDQTQSKAGTALLPGGFALNIGADLTRGGAMDYLGSNLGNGGQPKPKVTKDLAARQKAWFNKLTDKQQAAWQAWIITGGRVPNLDAMPKEFKDLVAGKAKWAADYPRMAKGGIVRQPTMALIGEAGPEAVVPLGKGMAGGMVVNVHVAGSVIRERDLAVRVRDEMAQMLRRRGLDPAVLGV